MAAKKITIDQLAKHKVGDTLYWVVLRPLANMVGVTDDETWMIDGTSHPKVIFERGKLPGVWPRSKALPKLHSSDFRCIIDILASKPMVEEFKILDLGRSRNTGEFYYLRDNEVEWMPESNLFKTQAAAIRERRRILKMVGDWAQWNGGNL